jgi:hypothetical protein
VALIATQIIAPPPREALVLDVGELSRYDRPPSGVSAYDALLEDEEA